MKLFKNQYRVESTRLPGWDYGQAGYYFVTICTKDRVHYFGEVVSNDMQLSPIGEIAAQEWIKTEIIRPNVKLDEWVIMPNHMHMIAVITYKIEPTPVETPEASLQYDYSGSTRHTNRLIQRFSNHQFPFKTVTFSRISV